MLKIPFDLIIYIWRHTKKRSMCSKNAFLGFQWPMHIRIVFYFKTWIKYTIYLTIRTAVDGHIISVITVMGSPSSMPTLIYTYLRSLTVNIVQQYRTWSRTINGISIHFWCIPECLISITILLLFTFFNFFSFGKKYSNWWLIVRLILFSCNMFWNNIKGKEKTNIIFLNYKKDVFQC